MTETNTIPKDPLSMPPPYWQDSEAIDQLFRALELFTLILPALSDEITRINPLLEEYADKMNSLGNLHDTEGNIFNEIHEEYIHLVYSLQWH